MDHPLIDHKEPLYVNMASFELGSIDIEIKAYAFPMTLEEFLPFKQEMMLRVYDIVLSAGADMPSSLKFFEKMSKMDS
jgi:hypothetical protein